MITHILSVDDEKDLEYIINQYFDAQIKAAEYHFFFAHDGIEALEILVEHPEIEIVLSDIHMPKMDGLTLLSKINEMQRPTLMCIMVSAYGDMENIRQAMNHGAYDFVTKPFNLKDLELTIKKVRDNIRFIHESQQNRRQLEQIRAELITASKIQHSILPNHFPPFPNLPIDIYAQMTPAYEVGGDFYDFFQIDQSHIGLVIADVSGKGIPASLLMAISRTMIRTVGMQGLSSNECLTYVNRLLFNECPDNMFITIFYGIYNVYTGHLDYTNAGHLAPYIIHSNGDIETLNCARNFLVGVLEDFSFKSNEYTLLPNDILFAYTDGITDTFNAKGKAFGNQLLQFYLPMMADYSLERGVLEIGQAIESFNEKAPQSDDITILAIKNKCQ